MTDDRLVTTARVDEDAQYEAGLRPRMLDEYIGQDAIRENLHVAIAAAKQRNEPLDHVRFVPLSIGRKRRGDGRGRRLRGDCGA